MKQLYFSLLLTTIFFTQPVLGQSVFPDDWSIKVRLEIDSDKINSSLTDFPVAVILDNTIFDFSAAQADGSDVRFTAADEATLLTFEREQHDNTGEQAVYWVKIPLVSSTENTVFYLYYDNSEATDASSTDGSLYTGGNRSAVLHMQQVLEEGDWFLPDSRFTNDGIKVSETSPLQVPGLIGHAQEFDGQDDLVTIDHATTAPGLNISSSLTLSAWVKPEKETMILDAVPNAVAAYSLRKLRVGYTENAIRVRRSSDNTESDIGFSGDQIDVSTLETFIGSGNNGYVVTWYDQSGNGKDVTQATAANQPIIVENGAVLISDGRPMVRFNNDFLDGTVDMGSQNPDATLNSVWKQDSDGKSEVPVFLGENANLNGLSIGYFYETRSGRPPYRENYIRLWEWDGYNYEEGYISNIKIHTGTYWNNGLNSEMRVYIDGTASSFLTDNAGQLDVGTGFATTPITLGANKDGTDYLQNAYVAEIIVYNKVLDSNERLAVERNQQKCYGSVTPVIAGKGRNAYQLEICTEEYRAYINNQVITAPATFGQYQHVVMTYDQTNLKLFVDGTEVASEALSGTINTNSNNLLLGNNFPGKIDEFRITNVARPADRVKADYHSGLNDLLSFDRSGFTVEPPGFQISGEEFNLNITGSRDGSGVLLNGSINVTVISNQTDDEVHNQAVTFTDGSAKVPVTLTEVATHNLTVEVTGVTNPVIVEVEVVFGDLSGFDISTTTALRTAGTAFNLVIENATDVSGSLFNGSINFSVTSDVEGEVFNGTRAFEDGGVLVNITLTIAGEHTLTVDLTGVTDDETIIIQVSAAAASNIVFITADRTITAGGTSDPITIQLQDAYGNEVPSDGITTINLDSDLGGTFRNELDDANITSITIADGQSEGSFRYTSTVAGIHVLLADDAATEDPLTVGTQNLTVDPSAAASIVFSTAERTITAGGTSDVITIQLQDVYGNVAESSGEITINLTSDPGGTFRNEVDNADITFVTIADGLSEGSFRYTSTVAGIHSLSAADAATEASLTGGTQNLMVDQAAAASIVFFTAERTITAGGTSDIITIQLQDVYGNVAESLGETTINLSSDLGGTFRNELDDANITSITIADGQSEGSFKYTSTVAGIHVLSADDAATEAPLTGGTQNLTVDAAAAASIVFTTAERTITAGETSDIIRVQLQDAYGNETFSSGITTVNLTSSDLEGTFRDEAGNNIISVEIAAQGSEASFRYTSTVTGDHLLSAGDNAATLTGNTQNLRVIGRYVFSVSGDWNNEGSWEGNAIPPSDSRVIINSGVIAGINSDAITVLYLDINGTIDYSTGSSLTVKDNGRITVESGGQLLAGEGMLVIDANAQLIIKPGGRVTSTGTMNLDNKAGTGGLIVESNATASGSIIQNSSGVQATVQRYVTGGVWQIISPPVSGMTVGDFINNASNDISYNSGLGAHAMAHYSEPDNAWAPFYTTNEHGLEIQSGRSYTVRRRNNGVLTFTGTLVTTQDYAIQRAANGWNGIGNPYASALKVKGNDGFLVTNANNLQEEYAALYIYDPDYPLAYRIINNNGAELPDGKAISQDYLQSGQGFLVKAPIGGSTVSFDGMKSHQTGTTYFKSKSSGHWPTIILNVSTDSKEATTVVTFNENMTKGLDVTYDAGLYGGDPEFKLYTKLVEGDNDINFAIQCLPDKGFEDMIIPVGLDFKTGGEVKFSTDILTLPVEARAVLEDRLLDIFTDLEVEDYIVTLDENTSGSGRFFIHTDYLITSIENKTEEPDATETEFVIYSFDKEVFILGEITGINYASLFDLTGRIVKTVRLENSFRNSFRVDDLSRGMYLVRVSGNKYNKAKRVLID